MTQNNDNFNPFSFDDENDDDLFNLKDNKKENNQNDENNEVNNSEVIAEDYIPYTNTTDSSSSFDNYPPSSDFNFSEDIDETFIPVSQSINTLQENKIIGKDSNFIFLFGNGQVGKSAILSTLLYYLNSQAGILKPKQNIRNLPEAEKLLYSFLENIRKGILPNRTTADQLYRMDFVFEPNNKSKLAIPINLTFLEVSGENLREVAQGYKKVGFIEDYLKPDIPLHFILVTSYDTAHKDDSLIISFLNKLESKGIDMRRFNAILIISKWDISGDSQVYNPEHFDKFLKERLPMTNKRMETLGLPKTYFTVGELEKIKDTFGQESARLKSLNLDSAEVLAKWLYKSIAKVPMDTPGTIWERIKSIFNNN